MLYLLIRSTVWLVLCMTVMTVVFAALVLAVLVSPLLGIAVLIRNVRAA